jgi:hypothetical protein
MVEMEFHFTKLDPEVALQIQQAIERGEDFGLTNGRTFAVFSPSRLMSAWKGGRTYLSGPSVFNYNSMHDLINAVSLHLLSLKTFIPASKFIDYKELLLHA